MAVSAELPRLQPCSSVPVPPPRQGVAVPGWRPPLTRLRPVIFVPEFSVAPDFGGSWPPSTLHAPNASQPPSGPVPSQGLSVPGMRERLSPRGEEDVTTPSSADAGRCAAGSTWQRSRPCHSTPSSSSSTTASSPQANPKSLGRFSSYRLTRKTVAYLLGRRFRNQGKGVRIAKRIY